MFDWIKKIFFNVDKDIANKDSCSINDVVGINTTQTNRNILTSRDIIRLDFTWMFLGL